MYRAMIEYKNNNYYSPDYNDIYFSVDDALSESRHVFLKSNNLPAQWQNRKSFVIGETGFGTGRNFLTTWQLWENSQQQQSSILHYISIEKHPLTLEQLIQTHVHFPEIKDYASQLQDAYPIITEGFHRLWFKRRQICLTLCFGDVEKVLSELNAVVDVWFLDGFAPAKNPQMWTDAVFKGIAKLSHTHTTLSTYTAAGVVKRGLEKQGFHVNRIQGHGIKKDMIIASMNQPQNYRNHAPWFSSILHRHINRIAVVVGAGIAGAQIANSLAQRDWQVHVIDKAHSLKDAASGTPLAVMSPRMTAQTSLGEKFSLQCFLYQLQQLQNLIHSENETIFTSCGVLVLAIDDKKKKQFQLIAERGFSNKLVQYHSTVSASKIADIQLSTPALYFPSAGYTQPKAHIQQLLTHTNIKQHLGQSVFDTTYNNCQWQAFDRQQNIIATGSILILANGHNNELAPNNQPTLIPMAGQTSYLNSSEASRALKTVIQHDGYILPASGNKHLIGSTYLRNNETTNTTEIENNENLKKLKTCLPNLAKSCSDISPAHKAVRATTRNRLPYIGALFDAEKLSSNYPHMLRRNYQVNEDHNHPGLYVFKGLGSRGMTNAALCAEHLASIICNEPSPFPKSIAHRLHPARDVIHALKKKTH